MAELQRAVLFTSMACAAIAMAQNPPKKPPPPVEIGKTSDDPVRVQSTLVNDTGQIAHDLHITGSTKDTSIVGAGATLTPNPFSSRSLSYSRDDNNNQNPKSITGYYSGGSVAKNGKIDLDLIAYLDRENNLYVSAYWTNENGKSIGSALHMGFNIKGPISSSGGGDPLRQGGGGGAGNFNHPFTFTNPGDKPLDLLGVSYFASMDYYGDMSTVPWATIPPVFTGKVTLLPQEEWSTAFETTGSYVGGNIYFKLLLGDGQAAIYGDHPVIPEPETWAMLAGLGLVGFAANRRLRASRSPR